jgi:uncharacterized protein (DUF433 family)
LAGIEHNDTGNKGKYNSSQEQNPFGETMNNYDRIVSDPQILDGKPCIRGRRITVQRVLKILESYPDRDELRRDYPQLEDEDIRQSLAYAAENLDERILVQMQPS